MEKSEKQAIKNPRQGANLLSIIIFKWLFKIFITGYKRELEVSDLYPPLDEHSSQFLGNKISRSWNHELERSQKLKNNPSLLRALANCFGNDIAMLGLSIGVLEFFVKTMQPIILANLLRYFRGSHAMERTEAYYWGTGIMLGVILDGLVSYFTFLALTHLGMKIRVACCSLVYRKLLRVSKVVVDGKTSIGQMVNLLSNDVSNFDTTVCSMHYVWITPIQTAIISYLLYNEVGLAALGGILTLLFFIPIHGFIGKLISRFTVTLTQRTDERLRLTNEIVSGVKVIKMYAWEKPFARLINQARKKEIEILRNNSVLFNICWSFEAFVSRACLFVTVLAYILLGNNIDAEKVYLITAYYNVLRISFYHFFPLSIKNIAETLVSIKRLNNVLLFKEINQIQLDNKQHTNSKMSNNSISLKLTNVTAKWNPESEIEVLKRVSFHLQSGSLTVVIGKVGVGKSALFQTILRELPEIKGKIEVNGKTSYASQEPWLFASSIKQNILCGKPMNRKRYEKVVEVCQLERDLQSLPYGGNTLVGERGIKLSGGQCARINLARAVYHEADIYLLDDPLSAVDARVGKDIFQDGIKGFLKGKTVLLITHQLHYLRHVDRVIVIDRGSVLVDGTYDSVRNSGINLAKLMEFEIEPNDAFDDNEEPSKESRSVVKAVPAFSVEEKEQSEIRNVGVITFNTYVQYFKAARNGFLVFVAFFLSAATQISGSGADYFITYWVNIEEKGGNFTSTGDHDFLLRSRDWYICVYGSIIALSVLIALTQAYTFIHMCMKISRNLYDAMFASILNTKMAFFSTNPTGRIMNRFSKDTGVIDTQIPFSLVIVVKVSFYALATACTVVNINPWLLIGAILVVVIAYFFRSFYMKSSRSINRLNGITRSPVYNHLSTSIQGLTTIRALNAQQILKNAFDKYQDMNSSAHYLSFSSSGALGVYIESLCIIFTGVVVYTLISLTDIAMVGDAGLVISYCMLMTSSLHWGIRQSTNLENELISVERVLEYSVLEQEPLLENTAAIKMPDTWPEQGQILFKDVSLTYDRQGKPALKDINFTVEPKEMIGIVGRTGAGKSSLVNALFRMSDIDGDIYIDNVPTSKIALQDLRSKISIIPQEPVLFTGSLRRNLDPFKKYADEVLWQALDDVELKEYLVKSNLSLDSRVTDGGANFSIGQRQLLCLARALIRNNRILVIDEATANVDQQTDKLIQKTIRKKFVDCTVLVIAHRINTVIDSNKILVMDAGRVVECDHPHNLLQRKTGLFYSMVQQTGAAEAENLFQVAKINYENSHVRNAKK